ncbi:hypothetical protein ABFS82_08G069900 [Erythranthe guttata]
MSASPFLPNFSNAITPFPHSPNKIQSAFFLSAPFTYSFITFCSSVANGSNSAKIEHENRDSRKESPEHIPHSRSTIKAPTAPWMNGPLLVKPSEILESRRTRTRKHFAAGRNDGEHTGGGHPDVDLTGKVGGARGKVAMKKIYKGIEKLQDTQNVEEPGKNLENLKFKFAPGALWGDKGEVEENTKEARWNLKIDEFDLPFGEAENEAKSKKMPWESDETVVIRRVQKEKVVTSAESSLDPVLLERLKEEAALIRKWVKVKKAGVTQSVVDQVSLFWRNNELALVNFDLPLCRNMDRAREIIEMKTGGLVVWSNKEFLAVYRGCNYKSGPKQFRNIYRNTTAIAQESCDGRDSEWESSIHMTSLYEREADRLLDGLGPRFVDWWMQKPLPVDGDLLPEVIPGFKTPFRLSPPSTRAKITDNELTYLRKLARPLPTHFVLGRNRKLQGLAVAILKLWEKCHIAKIAVKWGVQNTDNEQMANELKDLTGGVLLLRNKFLIILYRGNDFLPPEVAKLVAEREMELTKCQLEEEAARLKASKNFSITDENLNNSGFLGTLSEFHSIHSEISKEKKGETEFQVQVEAEKERLEKELKNQERKLSILKKKIEKSAKVLDKLKNESSFSKQDPDVETISEEERELLREMGLKSDSCLVLGRRGVYDGVIEGMHQHWKHREIVKVITMQKKLSRVLYTAKFVEAESGGILVSILKLKEGHAIIVYRGKNYKRPKLASINLLNKREALSKSVEIQRLGSLKFFASLRQQAIGDLRRKLAELLEKKGIDWTS